MILCLDAHYQDDQAFTAGGLSASWTADRFECVYTNSNKGIAAYEPGQFYLRELPGLVRLIESVRQEVRTIIIDGYCYFSNPADKGLGAHLYDYLEHTVPVIGVAKKPYHQATAALPVIRGNSKHPLWVTALGLKPTNAVDCIGNMHGAFRLPTLLRAVDRLARDAATSS